MTRFGLLALSSSLILLTGCEPSTTTSVETKPPIASAAEIGRRIERLSSDEFEGRAPGTPGGQAASQYIADEMKAAGLIPIGKNGTYFQPVRLTETEVQPSSNLTISQGDEILMQADQTTNSVFWTKRLYETQTIEDSDIIFVGYGVVATNMAGMTMLDLMSKERLSSCWSMPPDLRQVTKPSLKVTP